MLEGKSIVYIFEHTIGMFFVDVFKSQPYIFYYHFLSSREGTLKIGDRIVAVNSTPLNHITHNDALMIFKQLLGEACFKVEYDVSVMGEYIYMHYTAMLTLVR